jgi:hypothetical protein
MMFLQVKEGYNAAQVYDSLKGLWNMYGALKKGTIKDLPHQTFPRGKLSILIAYGLSKLN